MRSDIEEADHRGRMRAVLFYMLAILLILGGWVNFRQGSIESPWVFPFWIGTMLNFLPGTPLIAQRDVVRLMNDETTRDHRRTAMTAGFWAAMLAGMAMTVVARHIALRPFDLALVVMNAAMATAAICFATLELRAGR